MRTSCWRSETRRRTRKSYRVRVQFRTIGCVTVELIRIDVIHELPESERHCDHDGQLLTEIGKKLARL